MNDLDPGTQEALRNAGIYHASDLFTMSPQELSRKLGIADVRPIIQAAAREIAPVPIRGDEYLQRDTPESISTGDNGLNKLLGCGGLRAGKIWEVVGEGSSGKTQFALQLCLMSLLNPDSNEIERSACYISSGFEIRTERMIQILNNHPAFTHFTNRDSPSPSTSSNPRSLLENDVLSRVWHRQVESDDELVRLLLRELPALATRQSLPGRSPLKLVVIDSLPPLFQTENTSTAWKQRARVLLEVGALLRRLAIDFKLCVLVINNVTDVFSGDDRQWDAFKYSRVPHLPRDEPSGQVVRGFRNDLVYSSQANWFARTPLHLVQDGTCKRQKEALLGLSWTNQLDGRIMLSRTTKHINAGFQASHETALLENSVEMTENPCVMVPAAKRRRITGTRSESATPKALETDNVSVKISPLTQFSHVRPLRKLTVMFSEFASGLQTIGFIVSESGVHSVPDHAVSIDSSTFTAWNEPSYDPTVTDSVKPEILTHPASPVVAAPTVKKDFHPESKVELDDSEWAEYFPELFQGGEVDLSFDFDGDSPLAEPSVAGQEPGTMLPSVAFVGAETLLQSDKTAHSRSGG